MATFLLKLDSRKHIGGASSHPGEAKEWDGTTLLFGAPFLMTGGRARHITDGDRVIVWTHEDPKFGGGRGLTAEGIVENVQRESDLLWSARLSNVQLFRTTFRLQGRGDQKTGSGVIDFLLRHLTTRAYQLGESEAAEFRTVIDQFSIAKPGSTGHQEADTALIVDKQAVLDGFKRRLSQREMRPDQANFRAALMSLYNGNCAISKCNVDAALQAAHIVPFSESVALRNEPSNGLLLRADIHALFDRAMIAINPESYRVVLSAKLRETGYWAFNNQPVERLAASQFLRAQHSFFERMKLMSTLEV